MSDVNQMTDVVYGYKDGMGLVMDVYMPQAPRIGVGVIVAISGGWSTNLSRRHDLLMDPEGWGTLPKCLLDAGYTVFAVAHATQPRYTIEELRPDLPRAVRFIRHHADQYGIDPQRLGIVGGSSGGHVSLMTGLAPPDPVVEATDPVDRESSALQAVVAYFPPTDLLNYGETGVSMVASHGVKRAAALDFRCFDDDTGRFERITDAQEREACFRRNSPITHVRAGNPPVLLIHGDSDELVPLQQSERLCTRLAEEGVVHELVVLPGHGHAWPAMGNGQQEVVDWFGRYLQAQAPG